MIVTAGAAMMDDVQLGTTQRLAGNLIGAEVTLNRVLGSRRLGRDDEVNALRQLALTMRKGERLPEAVEYLRKALELDPSNTEALSSLVTTLSWIKGSSQKEAERVMANAVQRGLFRHTLQHPGTFLSVVRSRPFPRVDENNQLAACIEILQHEAGRLSHELSRLQQSRTMVPEAEGFADPHAGAEGWLVFDVRGRDACDQAPAACEVLAQLTRSGAVVQAGRFSLLKPGAHVRPHCASINDHITLQLPLPGGYTPRGGSVRVGLQTKRWREGKVVSLDDSFVTEMFNKAGTALGLLEVSVRRDSVRAQEAGYALRQAQRTERRDASRQRAQHGGGEL